MPRALRRIPRRIVNEPEFERCQKGYDAADADADLCGGRVLEVKYPRCRSDPYTEKLAFCKNLVGAQGVLELDITRQGIAAGPSVEL